jgi:hypothetical protein
MTRTAGEVRFIKDKSGNANEWAWNNSAGSQREIGRKFLFDPKALKPLATCLRSTKMAMGHSLSAYNTFTRLSSVKISPDGSLGGKGYIQKIADMRRHYMNVVEALSSLSDTLYDELRAPHWGSMEAPVSRERQEVVDIIKDVKEIDKDPEGWAEGEQQEMDEAHENDPEVQDE